MITYKIFLFVILTPISFLIFFLYFILHFVSTVIMNAIFATGDLYFPFEKHFSKYIDFYFGLIDFSK